MVKRVETPAGERYFGAPIGTPITAAMKLAARVNSARRGRLKGDAIAEAKGGGPKVGTPKPGSKPSGGFKGYHDAVVAAKTPQDLAQIVASVKTDRSISDKEAQAVLDAVEAKAYGGDPQVASLKDQITQHIQTAKDAEELKAAVAASKHLDPADQKDILDLIDQARSKMPDAKGKTDEKKPRTPTKPDTTTSAKAPTVPKRPAGAEPIKGEDNPAQAEFFANGKGSIADAEPKGLWNHVLSDKRFKVEALGGKDNKGISDSFWVTDTANNERWLFKSNPFNGKNGTAKVDTNLNEVMADGLFKEMGLPTSNVKHASDPTKIGGMLAQQDWAQLHVPDEKVINNVDDPSKGLMKFDKKTGFHFTPEALDKIKNGKDPDAALKMVLSDYLMVNGLDRHVHNFMLTQDKDGNLRMGMIDQGLAFGGEGDLDDVDRTEEDFKSFWSDYGAEQGVLSPDENGEAVVSRDAWHPSDVIAAVYGDKKTLRTKIKEYADQFSKVQAVKVYDDLESKGLSKQQAAYMDNWLYEYQWRADWLSKNIDKVTNQIAKAGGLK